MFNPKYNISFKLLENIKEISLLVAQLNGRHFPKAVLLNFENRANEISTYASTSIEGNPLSLTQVKRIIKTRPENIPDTEKEVLNYNKALEELKERIKRENIRRKS